MSKMGAGKIHTLPVLNHAKRLVSALTLSDLEALPCGLFGWRCGTAEYRGTRTGFVGWNSACVFHHLSTPHYAAGGPSPVGGRMGKVSRWPSPTLPGA